jgi:hypothetical protein
VVTLKVEVPHADLQPDGKQTIQALKVS